jgi:hypothetical protein
MRIDRMGTLLAATTLLIFLWASRATADTYNFTIFDAPGEVFGTYATGINNQGDIVGYYQTPDGVHSFLRDPAGILTLIDPLGLSTRSYGINDSGFTTGYKVEGSGFTTGFVRDPTHEHSGTLYPASSRNRAARTCWDRQAQVLFVTSILTCYREPLFGADFSLEGSGLLGSLLLQRKRGIRGQVPAGELAGKKFYVRVGGRVCAGDPTG